MLRPASILRSLLEVRAKGGRVKEYFTLAVESADRCTNLPYKETWNGVVERSGNGRSMERRPRTPRRDNGPSKIIDGGNPEERVRCGGGQTGKLVEAETEERFDYQSGNTEEVCNCGRDGGISGIQWVFSTASQGKLVLEKTEEEVKREIFNCISYLAPGPHVFLVVIRLGRFTKEEQNASKLIQTTFGEKALDYTMVLFTGGDNMEEQGTTIETFISKNEELHAFTNNCGGRYHVFNNKTNDPSQVRELLEKIKRMVQENGGKCYTNNLLEEAERAIREKMEKLLKKNPGMKVDEARKQAEKNNKFLYKYLGAGFLGTVAGAGAGVGVEVAIGAGLGAIGGPVGAVAGAALVAQNSLSYVAKGGEGKEGLDF
ncbi:hypothetical protein CCH79_00011856 [Gambusia affinis]|uniref:AIG1-type G domain-containing protein n=1 Tax=Gambusia affinis TaxID=33528 RepID=A0A315VMM9_GAMAF|nr:hypothetical protein CCH79_00011856 [Gambusia affinis]